MQRTQALPHFKGPKLEPFRFKDPAKPDITILEYIGRGLHSSVFKAQIDGQVYALKMVWPHSRQASHPLTDSCFSSASTNLGSCGMNRFLRK